jgi:outer membrane receptor for ferrienterochelin and colicin
VNINQSEARFYDASGKITYKFNQHNKLSLMGYISNDEFSTSAQSVTEYGSKLGNLTLNSRFAESLYGELELSYSEYDYRLTDYANQNPPEAYYLSNLLKYGSVGYHFKWHVTPRHNAEAGFKAVFNQISPGEIDPLEEVSLIEYQKLDDEKMMEWAVYAGDEFEVLPNFSIAGGLRYTRFNNIGTPVVYIYEPEKPITLIT